MADTLLDETYIGARIGLSDFNDGCESGYTLCETTTWGYGGFVGYQWNAWLALELAATDYHRHTATNANGERRSNIAGYQPSFRLSMPVGDRYSAFVRAGASYMDVARYSTAGLEDDDGWVPSGAVGAEVRLLSGLSLRLEYEYLHDVLDDAGHFASLALTYRFGGPSAERTSKSMPPAKTMTMAEVQPTVAEDARPLVEKPAPQPSNLTPAPILFALGSTALNHDARVALDRLAASLRSDQTVRLVGHTDNTGSSAWNQSLGQSRAQAVRRYLADAGVPHEQMTLVSHGEAEPVASNDTATGRRLNRRVEIIVEH
ncbi:OmpA family protein [Halomonas denitrificans]|nr:OmpA family protein [Halomonas denitrificans]